MTLGELAQLVGDKVNMTDAKTLSLIKRYAERRHSMLCRMGLWRELLNLYSITAKAGEPELILPPQVSTLVALRTDDANIMPADACYLFMTDPSVWKNIGTPTMFHDLPSVATREPPLGQQLSVESTSPSDVSGQVFIRGEWRGEWREEEVALTGTSPVTTAAHFDVLFSVTKHLSVQGNVLIKRAGDGVQIAELHTGELVRHYRRIRLLETPKVDTALVVLAKRTVHPLRADGDSTAFDGLDLPLEAFVLADVYEWLRQTGDANEKRAEAMALVEHLKRAEFYQEAQQQRLVPQVWGSETTEYDTLYGGI